ETIAEQLLAGFRFEHNDVALGLADQEFAVGRERESAGRFSSGPKPEREGSLRLLGARTPEDQLGRILAPEVGGGRRGDEPVAVGAVEGTGEASLVFADLLQQLAGRDVPETDVAAFGRGDQRGAVG